MRFLIENRDELVADDFAFGLRIGHALQLVEEALYLHRRRQVKPEFVAQGVLHLLKFISCAARRCSRTRMSGETCLDYRA